MTDTSSSAAPLAFLGIKLMLTVVCKGASPAINVSDEASGGEQGEEEQTKPNDKCGLVVHYDKAGVKKTKYCMSRKFMKKARNLCHRELWGEEGVVSDVCCHTCAMFYNQ